MQPPYERRIGKYVSHKDFFKCGLISFCNLTLGWRRQRGNHIILYQVGVRKGLKKFKFSFEMFNVANGWSTFKVVSTTSERRGFFNGWNTNFQFCIYCTKLDQDWPVPFCIYGKRLIIIKISVIYLYLVLYRFLYIDQKFIIKKI